MLTMTTLAKQEFKDNPFQNDAVISRQTDLFFDDTEKKAELSLLDFFDKSSTETRVMECRNGLWKITAKCECCNREFVTLGHCFIRYCSNCIPSKTTRAKESISDIMKDYPDFVSHLILTIPRSVYSKENKKFIENSKRKMFQNLHRHGMRFGYVSVVDYGNPKMTDSGLELGLHIHCALSVPYSFFLNPSFIQKLWAKATGIDNAVVKVVKSRKTAVIKYFARRVAGQFGHSGQYVYFDELMTVAQYDWLVRKSRTMSSFTGVYSCNRSAQLSHKKCAECGGRLKVLAISYCGSYVLTSMDWYPKGLGVT